MKPKKSNVGIAGNLWINRAENRYLGIDQINLLEKINELGSITKAAKAVGVCYKTAWDSVNAVNLRAEKPLVDRLIGGKGGGGTVLTPEGKKVIAQFKTIMDEHRKFLENMGNKLGDSKSMHQFLRSARNLFPGTVSRIFRGTDNAEVTLTINGGSTLTAVIANRAVDNLPLKVGAEAYAIIKASSIILGTDLHLAKSSARNIFCGTVAKLTHKSVNTEVEVEIDGGNTISVLITNDSAKFLELEVGSHACTLFKASSVIIGVN